MPNLIIVSSIDTSGRKVLGLLSNLKMNNYYSSGVIANFGLGTGVVGGFGGNGTRTGVRTFLGGVDVSSSFLRNLLISMFLERGIHPSMPTGMIDEDVLGDICFRNIYTFGMNETKKQSVAC